MIGKSIIQDQSNAILQRKLDRLLLEGRRNDERWRRFQSLELSLMRSGSLPEMLRTVLYDYRAGFGWDVISLTLHDPEYEIHRLLDSTGSPRSDFPELFLVDTLQHIDRLFEHGRRPILGPYRARLHSGLFPKSDQRLSSTAILPLIRNRRLIGSLTLASYNPDKFQENTATDFMEHLAAVVSVCLEMAEIRERLRFIGLTDGLTGINNRRFFDQRLHEELERTRRDRVSLGCLFIDLDHFKRINDNFGHQVGDDVLRYVAQLIREQLRSIDVVARYGGEEFAVLLAQADIELAMEIAERIRKNIEQWEYDPNEIDMQVSVSVGVATTGLIEETDDISETAHKLVEAADQAVYKAKESGRNRVISHHAKGTTGEQLKLT